VAVAAVAVVVVTVINSVFYTMSLNILRTVRASPSSMMDSVVKRNVFTALQYPKCYGNVLVSHVSKLCPP
jgi:hypothetical protein